MKNSILLFVACMLYVSGFAQKDQGNGTSEIYVKPKLVVGIVVDQMRYDYLTRFYNKYGEGGFKRMINEGFNCKNNHFNYIPTKTAPGHASVFTGTSPMNHGVIGNNWYDKETKESVYCAGDAAVVPLGTKDKAGLMSPRRMLTTTFADENRLFTQMEGKTIGISVKDRGAILPAGHTANAAYWFHGKDEGVFISSTYYQEDLPKWVQKFNSSNTAKSYLKDWNTLYNIKTYTESGIDENEFERGFTGKETASFPYDLKKLSKENGNFDIIKGTPYGNSIIADFAIAAIKGEDLGKDDVTDVLTVSFSSTDYVGHNFGVNSKEVEDTYLRLDKDLERMFKILDSYVGKGEYTVFLTADHGAVDVPAYLHSHDVPSGYFGDDEFTAELDRFMTTKYGASDLIENVSNNQIFLDRNKVNGLNLNLADVQQEIANHLITLENINVAYSASVIANNDFTTGVAALLKNGYNQRRSGDILFEFSPAVISYPTQGSTHGSGLNHDTHVPLLFFGKGIKHGSTLQKTEIIDIAPTVSGLLGISFPNGSTGKPLEFVLEN
ncbi:alkaline phosphatase; Type I phosph odiesterase/nucleotide pyrophosphatase precursor [Formosa agariphila KMM 3901]|uniref:Alkaline phosphatase Type I phosph odiesterase/nucleotide pyrophosphatase n=1 Tax=Formosa agariphila (strain DSM 15362 / KCTC 12365 / LMG 23005 / KMM 3901 / M-2Alg 35-1) TaxID=1347342 RepID=T2KHP0_FORAG|nr:alkaline phosphatase PafA [Formosa agariphila]CDF78310.1 alkaline phosphatase; Type I phosph odiesterase/nucleotide pyrophosphatase precursor [Formosa agariphila KMM 3901]